MKQCQIILGYCQTVNDKVITTNNRYIIIVWVFYEPIHMKARDLIRDEKVSVEMFNSLNAKVTTYRNQSIDLLRKSNDWFLYVSNFGV